MNPEPITMNLCEVDYVILKVGVPYIFEADPECERCRELRDVYAETNTSK